MFQDWNFVIISLKHKNQWLMTRGQWINLWCCLQSIIVYPKKKIYKHPIRVDLFFFVFHLLFLFFCLHSPLSLFFCFSPNRTLSRLLSILRLCWKGGSHCIWEKPLPFVGYHPLISSAISLFFCLLPVDVMWPWAIFCRLSQFKKNEKSHFYFLLFSTKLLRNSAKIWRQIGVSTLWENVMGTFSISVVIFPI